MLVHCRAGVSRSATIVLAYCMHDLGMKLKDCLKMVKEKRKIVDPNEGFMEALKTY